MPHFVFTMSLSWKDIAVATSVLFRGLGRCMKSDPSVVVFKILDKPASTCSLLSVVLTGKIAEGKKQEIHVILRVLKKIQLNLELLSRLNSSHTNVLESEKVYMQSSRRKSPLHMITQKKKKKKKKVINLHQISLYIFIYSSTVRSRTSTLHFLMCII